MARPAWAPEEIDINRPSAARVYDYFLGGAHNFTVDRQLAEEVARITPDVGDTMRANRAFLRRAVRHLAGEGIRQFLDIGSGIPTVGNVHEVAAEATPDARVVYIDADPVAVSHSRAMLRDGSGAAVFQADLREPAEIIALARASGLIDFSQPVAVLLLGVVHFLTDSDDPAGIVAALRDAVPDGSYLALSHVTYDDQPPEVVRAFGLSRATSAELVLRSHGEIAGFFSGLKLIDPGLVHLPLWRPEHFDDVGQRPERIGAFAGVGHKG